MQNLSPLKWKAVSSIVVILGLCLSSGAGGIEKATPAREENPLATFISPKLAQPKSEPSTGAERNAPDSHPPKDEKPAARADEAIPPADAKPPSAEKPASPAQSRLDEAIRLIDDNKVTKEQRKENLSKAHGLLAQNLSAEIRKAEPKVHCQSLKWIGMVDDEQKDYEAAVKHFQDFLRLYPRDSEILTVEYMLAKCHYFVAHLKSMLAGKQHERSEQIIEKLNGELSDAERRRLENEWMDVGTAVHRMSSHLKESQRHAEHVESELLKREKKQRLSDADKQLLFCASSTAVNCIYLQGNFADAARRYERLRYRCEGTVNELVCLAQLWQCYDRHQLDPVRGKQMLVELRETMATLPDGAFDENCENHKRCYWEDWLKKADPAGTTTKTDMSWKRLGVRVSRIDSRWVTKVNPQLHGGVMIEEVAAKGPAADAGIKEGDILVGLNDSEIVKPDDLAWILNDMKSGNSESVKFFVIRDGKIHDGVLHPTE